MTHDQRNETIEFSPTHALSEAAAQRLLNDLCVIYGYCLPHEKQLEIIDSKTTDLDDFVERVVRAEGLNPLELSKQAYRQLRNHTAMAFIRDHEKNA